MKKIDAVVWQETGYIAIWVAVFSALMQSVFLMLHAWDYTVLLGNLLTGVAGILNFFLMALSVQNALEKEEKEAKGTMKLSQTYRFLFLAAVVALGCALPVFQTWAVIIPVFFPRVAIALRPLFDKKGAQD